MLSKRRGITISILLGVFFAACWEIGWRAESADKMQLMDAGMIISLLCKAMLISVGIYLSWTVLPKLIWKCKSFPIIQKVSAWMEPLQNKRIPFAVKVLLLLFMWLPVFLAVFPGAFSYDATEQWRQVLNWQLLDNHPVVHTLLVGTCVEGAYRLFGSYNIGIFIYTILQMIFLACVFSYTLSFMKKHGANVLLRLFAFLFLGLSPTIQLFVVCTTKDIYFSGMLLLFLMELIDYSCDREAFFASRSRKLRFVWVAFGTCILRSNGVYIVMIVLAIMLWQARKIWKRLLPSLAGIGVLFLLYTIPLYQLLGVQSGGIQAMLCVPIQQVTRVYLYHYSEVEAEDIQLVEELLGRDNMLWYVSTMADPVKEGFVDEVWQDHKMDYVRIWLKWGAKYPVEYITSFLLNTMDYWYPGGVVDGRNPLISCDYCEYHVGLPGEHIEMLPGVHEYYRSIAQDRATSLLPGMFLIISPGWYFMIFLYLCGYFFAAHSKELFLPMLSIFLLMLTTFLGPIAIVRYVLILFYALPLLLTFVFRMQNDPQEIKKKVEKT